MNWERIAEQQIREAMREGKFEGLAREGAIDLEEYFKLPAELRMAYSILKSAGFVPEEVQMLGDVERLRAALEAEPDEAARARLRAALTQAKLKLDIVLERSRLQRQRAARPPGSSRFGRG